MVIDEALAKSAFGGQDPIGKNLWIPEMPCVQTRQGDFVCKRPFKVVGLVRHVRYWGLAGDDSAQVRAQLYYPFSQVAPQFLPRWSQLMSIAVRTSVPPLSILDSLRQELRGDAGDQVLYQVRTMEQLAHESLAQQRFLVFLFSVFAGLLFLAMTYDARAQATAQISGAVRDQTGAVLPGVEVTATQTDTAFMRSPAIHGSCSSASSTASEMICH